MSVVRREVALELLTALIGAVDWLSDFPAPGDDYNKLDAAVAQLKGVIERGRKELGTREAHGIPNPPPDPQMALMPRCPSCLTQPASFDTAILPRVQIPGVGFAKMLVIHCHDCHSIWTTSILALQVEGPPPGLVDVGGGGLKKKIDEKLKQH
jgi:hypothetical protein